MYAWRSTLAPGRKSRRRRRSTSLLLWVRWQAYHYGALTMPMADAKLLKQGRSDRRRVLYFRIYAQAPALGIFNFGNAVLSANGDTKRPLVYLTIAGVLT